MTEERKSKARARSKAWTIANKARKKATNAAWYIANKAKKNSQSTTWHKQHPFKGAAYARKHRFGLTEFDYNRMCDEQGFSCAICRGGFDAPKTGKRATLHVDHSHTTGRIRGLLCGRCNQALGLFQESLGRMRAAMQYLLDKG